jgi:hypothetical protein
MCVTVEMNVDSHHEKEEDLINMIAFHGYQESEPTGFKK